MDHAIKSQPASSFWKKVVKSEGSSLDDVDKIEEVLYGLFTVLTFTCTISTAHAGNIQVDTMLRAAFGCNIAWGTIDACLLIFSIMMYRGRVLRSLHSIRDATSDDNANFAIKDTLPPLISSLMKEEYVSYLKDEFRKLPAPPRRIFLTWDDMKAALTVFLLVFLSTFPLSIPFIFISDVLIAHRVSNGIALLLLFVTGFYLGKRTKLPPCMTGLAVLFIGVMLVAVTIILGG